MCSGLNFTRLNQKKKELLTSIFARLGSLSGGTAQSAAVAGAGIRGESSLKVGKSVEKQKR